MALATTIPFVGLFLTWFLLPESPRWLLAQGRYQEAKTILETIARYTKWCPKNCNCVCDWLEKKDQSQTITRLVKYIGLFKQN